MMRIRLACPSRVSIRHFASLRYYAEWVYGWSYRGIPRQPLPLKESSMTVTNATMTSVTNKRGRRGLALGFVVTTAAALFVGGLGATASAAPDDSVGVSAEVASRVGSDHYEPPTSRWTVCPALSSVFRRRSLYDRHDQQRRRILRHCPGLGRRPDRCVRLLRHRHHSGRRDDRDSGRQRHAGCPQAIGGTTAGPVELHTQGARSLPSGGNNYYERLLATFSLRHPDIYTVTLNYLATALA